MSEPSGTAVSTLSRRQMLRTAAVGAGVALGGSAISSLLGTSPALAGTGAAAFVPDDLDLHLLRRASIRSTERSGTERWRSVGGSSRSCPQLR